MRGYNNILQEGVDLRSLSEGLNINYWHITGETRYINLLGFQRRAYVVAPASN